MGLPCPDPMTQRPVTRAGSKVSGGANQPQRICTICNKTYHSLFEICDNFSGCWKDQSNQQDMTIGNSSVVCVFGNYSQSQSQSGPPA